MLILKRLTSEHGSSQSMNASEITQLMLKNSKPADLAILKSLGADSTHVEHDIVEVFSQKDDYVSDFEFTPIHIAVLDIYKPTDVERPTLEQ